MGKNGPLSVPCVSISPFNQQFNSCTYFCNLIYYSLLSISGLILFIGQVVYISIIKAEVANKLIPVSMLSPPRLRDHTHMTSAEISEF